MSGVARRAGGRGGAGGDSQVITASTWLSNILPAPREDGAGAVREQSPSPQHKAIAQVNDQSEYLFIILTNP